MEKHGLAGGFAAVCAIACEKAWAAALIVLAAVAAYNAIHGLEAGYFFVAERATAASRMSAAVRRTAASLSAGAPAPHELMGGRTQRRWASAAFAHMKVKKQNWVEVSARRRTWSVLTGRHTAPVCVFSQGQEAARG
jgi:hypothetical protein